MTEALFDIVWDDTKARSNLLKHGVSFAQAASVVIDPLALTVFDTAHSEAEERWYTLGQTSAGRLLVVAHTYQILDTNITRVRLISARYATRQERRQYEENF